MLSGAMPDDDKPSPKPDPLQDVRKGLGLLFRAAKTTVGKLPTKDIEEVVVTSAREVGRALENVGRSLEREVFGKKDERTKDEAAEAEGKSGGDAPAAKDEAKTQEPKSPGH
jgi:hypothetical protein